MSKYLSRGFRISGALLLLIPLLIGTSTGLLHAMTPYEYGKEHGKSDALGNIRDSGDACGKYFGKSENQCDSGYNLMFNQTCLAHPMVKDTEPPEYASCYDYFHPSGP